MQPMVQEAESSYRENTSQFKLDEIRWVTSHLPLMKEKAKQLLKVALPGRSKSMIHTEIHHSCMNQIVDGVSCIHHMYQSNLESDHRSG